MSYDLNDDLIKVIPIRTIRYYRKHMQFHCYSSYHNGVFDVCFRQYICIHIHPIILLDHQQEFHASYRRRDGQYIRFWIYILRVCNEVHELC